MREFKKNHVYYMLWHADPRCLFLSPEAMVFIGKGIDPEYTTRDAWYFQDARSFCEDNESARRTTPVEVRQAMPIGKCYRLHEDELDQMVDFNGLVDEIRECQRRWAQLNESPFSDTPSGG